MTDIRIITEPAVTVICRPQIDVDNLFHHLDTIQKDRDPSCALGFSGADTLPGDALPEVAGRLCYRSWQNPRPGGNPAYLGHIKEVGHGSVLEHCMWSFLISGISRTLSHELVRHRIGIGISQVSQRYVDEGDVAFVLPPADLPGYMLDDLYTDLGQSNSPFYVSDSDRRFHGAFYRRFHGAFCRRFHGAFCRWKHACQVSLNAYRARVDDLADVAPADLSGTERRKWARQAARAVLPGCTETAMVWSANARALRHCIEMRANKAADVEIRRLFIRILKLMQVEAPNLFGDYTIITLPDFTEAAETPYRKV